MDELPHKGMTVPSTEFLLNCMIKLTSATYQNHHKGRQTYMLPLLLTLILWYLKKEYENVSQTYVLTITEKTPKIFL
jgi:hypothetical protein